MSSIRVVRARSRIARTCYVLPIGLQICICIYNCRIHLKAITEYIIDMNYNFKKITLYTITNKNAIVISK